MLPSVNNGIIIIIIIIIISSYPQLFIVEIHEGKHRKKRTVDE